MRSFSSRAGRSVLTLAVVALSACSDHPDATEASPNLRPRLDVVSIRPTISALTLSSNTIVIGNSTTRYTATLQNGGGSRSSMVVVGVIVQGTQHFTAVASHIALPTGVTTVSYAIPLPTPLPSGAALVPGPATFQLQMYDDLTTEAPSVMTAAITLVPNATITALSPGSTALTIGGASSSYAATIQNADVNLSGAAVQGWITQSGANTARRAAASSAVQCGGGSGVLPSGTCSISGFFLASSTMMGSGTLLPGPALFELDLVVNGVVVSQKSVSITLGSSASITGVTLNSTRGDTALIEGENVAYTTTLKNVGASMSGLALQGTIVQGSAHRFAGGGALSCTTTSGVLPNGTCTFAGQLTATNNTAGEGTLISGSATFQVQLVDASGNVLSTANIPLTLVEGPLTSPLPGPDANTDRSPRSSGAGLARP